MNATSPPTSTLYTTGPKDFCLMFFSFTSSNREYIFKQSHYFMSPLIKLRDASNCFRQTCLNVDVRLLLHSTLEDGYQHVQVEPNELPIDLFITFHPTSDIFSGSQISPSTRNSRSLWRTLSMVSILSQPL